MPDRRLHRARVAYAPANTEWLLEQQRLWRDGPADQLHDIFLRVVNRCAQAFIALDRVGADLPDERDPRWVEWSAAALSHGSKGLTHHALPD